VRAVPGVCRGFVMRVVRFRVFMHVSMLFHFYSLKFDGL
jgi:hypothetical protein